MRPRFIAASPSLLAGLIYDQDGNRLVSSHTNKDGKRYRYYVQSPHSGRDDEEHNQPSLRLPAADTDAALVDTVVSFLTNNQRLVAEPGNDLKATGDIATILNTAAGLASMLERSDENSSPEASAACRQLLHQFITRVEASTVSLTIVLDIRQFLPNKLQQNPQTTRDRGSSGTDQPGIRLQVPIQIKTAADSAKLVLNPASNQKLNRVEITNFARGFCWFEQLTLGKAPSIRAVATAEGVSEQYVSRLMEQAFASPEYFGTLTRGE